MTQNHLTRLEEALHRFAGQAPVIDDWGRRLAGVLENGGRLLACGNGGSAAQAQHLTAELVGRYRDERDPYSAIALTAETCSVTAILNDYGADEVFARQVRAHGRPGDVLLCLSTSGSSRNVIAAARAAAAIGVRTWALTGPQPNPLAGVCEETVPVDADQTCTVQEIHLAAVHMLCEAVDETVLARPGTETAALDAAADARPAGGADRASAEVAR